VTVSVLLIGDYEEERWPSMDLVYEMLLEQLSRDSRLRMSGLRPPMRRRFSGETRFAGAFYNADRLLSRFLDYPRHVSGVESDLYHITDHSYSQLAHRLPAERTVITCHDFDTFRSLFGEEERPLWFRLMTRRILTGLQRAAAITCDSEATRQELLSHGIVQPARTRVIRLGVDSIFSSDADPEADGEAERLLGPGLHILHVGSTAPRKRLDVLIDALAGMPEVTLIRVGGPLTDLQQRQATLHGVAGRIRTLPFVDRRLLAAVYRRAAVAVLPSEREGFGFPVVEALACGTPVVASDLPVLREVGGEHARYVPVGDADGLAAATLELAVRAQRVQASVPRWESTAAQMTQLYLELAQGSGV
jgi:glycosyltransferase involved in cell wall biosynthesis